MGRRILLVIVFSAAVFLLFGCTFGTEQQAAPVENNTALEPYPDVRCGVITRADAEDIVYSVDLEGRTFVLAFYQLEKGAWVRNETAVYGSQEEFDLVLHGAAVSQEPYYRNASSGILEYQAGESTTQKAIDISLKDPSNITVSKKFFSIDGLTDEADTVLGYIVYSNDRVDISGWEADVLPLSELDSDRTQVIRVGARVY